MKLANIWQLFSFATLPIFGIYSHTQFLKKNSTPQLCEYEENIFFCNIAYIWKIFSSATLPIFGRYSHLKLANITRKIFSSATLPTFGSILIFCLPIFGKSFPLQLCHYLANILLCKTVNSWHIFSSATFQHLENILLCNIANCWQIFSSATCQYLENILLWKTVNIWQIFHSATVPIFCI